MPAGAVINALIGTITIAIAFARHGTLGTEESTFTVSVRKIN